MHAAFVVCMNPPPGSRPGDAAAHASASGEEFDGGRLSGADAVLQQSAVGSPRMKETADALARHDKYRKI
jgi:hypothetical protein